MIEKPLNFSFNDENLKKANLIIKKYPEGKQKSAILPLFDLAQRQNGGWLSQEAIEYVAKFLDIPFMRAHEVATFYTMFNLKPVGKYHIQVCTTTPCWLRGADDIVKTCKEKLGINLGEVSKDSQFSLIEVECLGACINAPLMQINDDYFEDLNTENVNNLINKMQRNQPLIPGSQINRNDSAPVKM